MKKNKIKKQFYKIINQLKINNGIHKANRKEIENILLQFKKETVSSIEEIEINTAKQDIQLPTTLKQIEKRFEDQEKHIDVINKEKEYYKKIADEASKRENKIQSEKKEIERQLIECRNVLNMIPTYTAGGRNPNTARQWIVEKLTQ